MKLLSASTPGKNDYTEFMTKFVCDIENHYCILHSCIKCANMSEIEPHLLDHFYECNFHSDNNVNFKQWIQRERGISCNKKHALLMQWLDKSFTYTHLSLYSIFALQW